MPARYLCADLVCRRNAFDLYWTGWNLYSIAMSTTTPFCDPDIGLDAYTIVYDICIEPEPQCKPAVMAG